MALDQATQERLKQRLLDEKQRLQSQIDRDNQDIREMTADQYSESTYSNHLADDAGDLEDIDRTTLIEVDLRQTIEQIDRALQLMDEGKYGLSEVSGKEIPVERLEALPWATRLVDE